jgi:hypothetical protein
VIAPDCHDYFNSVHLGNPEIDQAEVNSFRIECLYRSRAFSNFNCYSHIWLCIDHGHEPKPDNRMIVGNQ